MAVWAVTARAPSAPVAKAVSAARAVTGVLAGCSSATAAPVVSAARPVPVVLVVPVVLEVPEAPVWRHQQWSGRSVWR
ncbi:Uncharacterised protein [Mycobacterium tuberculosis]|nr:Uncharacterised protein [Mycobacterium tuberculosis]CKR66098.1 Uncharacterised protein [Mycobacterium tuberculosis]CKU54048.1 Uncharacterised protein [Mycobacterium tuberculosis]CKW60245.1 Uncharacterised protein [Mycobacterium tuberculosis]CKZ06574.1 Uncharacterised protein [Mycobacterium tuberculosis]